MRDSTIARNYADALFALASKAGDLDGWGALISGLSDAVRRDDRLRNFLEAPQVSAQDKKRVVEKAFTGKLPQPMMRFVQKLIENRRQMLLTDIAVEYANLVDERAGRVHAQVTVARELSDTDRATMTKQLTERLGKVVVPHVAVNPAILGGVIVKVGDTVMDGSVRRRLSTLRGRLLNAR